ncbi:MAG: nuclear transport factor 2 family protein [Pseudomonadota bacterium]|nr:nuclear transport factor 2 family protein [Pseudomonadota bacterium]
MNLFMKAAIAFVLLSGSAQILADEDHDAERAVLLEKLAFIESALNEKAFERVVPLLDEDVVIVFLNGEVTRGIDEARAYFDKTLGSTNPILSDYTTKAAVGAPARFIGHIAVADGSTRDTFVFVNGSEMVVDAKWTVTLEKRSGDWKVLQLQFSSNLFDNPLARSARNNLAMFSGVSAIAGLVIGFLIGRRRKSNA